LENAQQEHLRNERRYVYATAEDIIGRIYLQIVEGTHLKFSLLKNIGFLIRNVPSASREAEKHFNSAIRISEQIGAMGTLGNAYFNLGLLYKAKGIKNQAHDSISKAITCFEKCEAEAYLKEAREILGSIE
jgi:tetratricopeptide (TPR) repeat protein